MSSKVCGFVYHAFSLLNQLALSSGPIISFAGSVFVRQRVQSDVVQLNERSYDLVRSRLITFVLCFLSFHCTVPIFFTPVPKFFLIKKLVHLYIVAVNFCVLVSILTLALRGRAYDSGASRVK